MRDISPSPKPSFSRKDIPEDLPPEAKKLYEKHANKAAAKKPVAKSSARRFTGSQIPITNVHVPKQTLPEKRPLFAVIDKSVVDKKTKKTTALKPATKKPKKSRASMMLGTKEKKIAWSLFAVVLVTACIAVAIFLPSATIALNVQTAPLLVDQKLTLTTNPTSDPNSIAASVFSQQLQIQGSSLVSHTEVIGTKAKGTVQVVNKTFETQKIKEHSRLTAKDGTLFYMLGPAIIPPAEKGSPSAVSVQVEAAESGEKGNIQPQVLNFAALDASAQAVVYAQTATAFTGGSGQEVHTVADTDIDQAHDAAKIQAKAQAQQAAQAQLKSGWAIMDESWDVQLSNFTAVQKAGDKADNVTFTANATVRALMYQDDAMKNAVQNSLSSHLDPNMSLFPGTISFTKSVDSVDWDKGQASVTARVTHTTIPNFSLDTLKDKLVGRSKDDALTYLQGLQGVQNADVKLWPFWVQHIPQIQQRINITVNSDR